MESHHIPHRNILTRIGLAARGCLWGLLLAAVLGIPILAALYLAELLGIYKVGSYIDSTQNALMYNPSLVRSGIAFGYIPGLGVGLLGGLLIGLLSPVLAKTERDAAWVGGIIAGILCIPWIFISLGGILYFTLGIPCIISIAAAAWLARRLYRQWNREAVQQEGVSL